MMCRLIRLLQVSETFFLKEHYNIYDKPNFIYNSEKSRSEFLLVDCEQLSLFTCFGFIEWMFLLGNLFNATNNLYQINNWNKKYLM